jgi:hypothetical protein
MKFLIILLFIVNIYAKNNNIFLDTEVSVPFFGIAKEIDGEGDENTYSFPTMFLGVSLGYSFKVNKEWYLEPSTGFHINSGSIFNSRNWVVNYDYYDVTLPLMYYKRGIKKGVFLKYIGIPSFEYGGNLKEKIQIKNEKAYAIGVKLDMKSLFFTYEYIFNGIYYAEDKVSYVDIEGSRLSIGIRRSF